MSKELESIKGKIELPNPDTSRSNYTDREVFLTAFYGGIERGDSLQITFTNEFCNPCHIQIDSSNIEKLKQILNEHFK